MDLGTWIEEQYRIPGPPLTHESVVPESPTRDEHRGEG